MPAGAEQPPQPGPETGPGPGGGPAGAGLFTLPNAITFARLCAVPAAVWLVLQHRLDLAFWVFVAAGISDGIDGWLARVTNSRSRLGAILDPAADKALLVSTYVTLAAVGVLPDWIAILVVFRDLIIVGGVLVLYLAGHPPAIQPILLSKANTAMQIALAAGALFLAGWEFRAEALLQAMIALTAVTTVASGFVYVLRAARGKR